MVARLRLSSPARNTFHGANKDVFGLRVRESVLFMFRRGEMPAQALGTVDKAATAAMVCDKSQSEHVQ